jgi:hypothetical protein
MIVFLLSQILLRHYLFLVNQSMTVFKNLFKYIVAKRNCSISRSENNHSYCCCKCFGNNVYAFTCFLYYYCCSYMSCFFAVIRHGKRVGINVIAVVRREEQA